MHVVKDAHVKCEHVSLDKYLLTLYLFTSKCRLLITFVKSLDPDQARQNVCLIRIEAVCHPDSNSEGIF